MNTEAVGPSRDESDIGRNQTSVLSETEVVGDIERFLREAIGEMKSDAAEGERFGPGRPRVLPSLALWAGMLVCVLRGFSSQLAIWRLLSQGQFWFYPRFPVTDQAVYARLEGAGVAPLVELFEQISLVLRQRLAGLVKCKLAPFATEIVALDETTLDQVARMLPILRGLPKGDKRLLPSSLVGLFDIRRQQWRRVEQIEDPSQNEKVAARNMVADLPIGSLILADLGYFSFAWFDHLTDNLYHWVSRMRAQTSYEVLHVCYQQGEVFDGIVWLGAYRADRAAHAVRLVRFLVKGQLRSYITNVLDPCQLPMLEIARLYARRWDFELAVKLIKRYLKLHLLWSAKDVVVSQQVWAVLIISQILQALRVEIAARTDVDPFDVSMALLIEYLPQYAYTGQDPLEVFVNQGRELRFIRPSTRTKVVAPEIDPAQIVPLPTDLVLTRTPRHSHRNRRPRSPNTHTTTTQRAN